MKTLLYISSCLLGSIIIIIGLYLSEQIDNKRNKNNFQRIFLSTNPLDSIHVLDLKYNSYYIAGLTKKKIYLANATKSDFLILTDYDLTDTLSMDLNIPEYENVAWGAIKTQVDSPYVYIAEGIVPTVIQGTFPDFQYMKTNLKNLDFNKSVAIKPSNIVIRRHDSELQQTVLVKAPMNPSSLRLDTLSYALEKQLDGFFCSDGVILYNHHLAQIIYVYAYRNQFIGLDANLNVLYKGNTIDTISRAKIKVDTLVYENKTQVKSSNAKIVNKRAAVHKDWLYVHSGLMADNELKEHFDENSVIDVYSLRDQKYKFSFYLPVYKDKKVHDFKVDDNKIVAMHDRFLITYRFNPLVPLN
ncbi:MAG: hypothetical protein MI921_20660 [Cytophagales bacterium]|nr:hypothetical protein [Cytophagales bacterium]